MTTPRKARLFLACSALTLAALPACSDKTSTGADYTLTIDRRLEAYLTAPLPRAHDAALAAVREDMKYRLVYQTVDAREGVLEARTATGEEVKVQSFKNTDGTTRVLVGVGPLGDEPAMRELLAAIDRRSRTGAAASAPAASAGSAGSKPTGAVPRPASTASGEEKPTAAEPKPR